MSDHAWVQDNITSYESGGLSAEERDRLEKHTARCTECARELAQWRSLDQVMEGLFASQRPAAGLEDRLIDKLRSAPPVRWWRRPLVLRWAGAVAAVIFLGLLGAGLHRLVDVESLQFPGAWEGRGAEDGKIKVLVAKKNLAMGEVIHNPEELFAYKEFPKGKAPEGENLDIQEIKGKMLKRPLRAQDWITVDDLYNQNDALQYHLPGGYHAVGIRVPAEAIAGGFAALPHSRVDVLATIKRGDDNRAFSKVLLEDVMVVAADTKSARTEGGSGLPETTVVTLAVKPEDAAKLNMAKELGTLSLALRKFGEKKSVQSVRTSDVQSLREEVTKKARGEPAQEFDSSITYGQTGQNPSVPMQDSNIAGRSSLTGGALEGKAKAPSSGPAVLTVTPPPPSMPADPGKRDDVSVPGPVPGPGQGGAMAGFPPANGTVAKTEDYFKLTTSALDKAGQEKGANPKAQVPDSNSAKEPAGKKRLDDATAQKKTAEEALKEKSEPAAVSRKIIRTGEIEFEVEGFDDAVDSVTRLINSVRGGFVATVNSEKLPNGKVRGSVVVRMPPEHLDKFLLDLRKELAKAGELKGQRIGSLDVTKQYYDLESRLRAARTMEERLINIIKSGQGQIKDLLNAERELGVWRTKIEEMEGEIRYYHNQVSLSTLTITLFEKEIRAPSAVVISERHNLELEVEEVDKAYQTALAAIAKAKGRVSKADLRQHAAGQLEAILQFEVAPAEADNLRTLLRGLGNIVHQDVERLQQTEGGSGRLTDGKTRQNDTQFHVVLYNVANIQPRQTFTISLDAADVPGGYRKLQEAVAALKGQVRGGNLNEQDALNVSAQFDFDVPTAKRDLIEKTLAELGEVFARTQTQASPKERATERKVGYRVTFRNLAGIPPRETWTVHLDVANVPEGYRKLQEFVAKAKGFVRGGNLNEQDRLNISAHLDFDLPSAKRGEIDKIFTEIGDIFTRSAVQAQPGQTVTDRKVGFRVTFRNLAGIPPRQAFHLEIAAVDVADTFRKLQELALKVKGQVGTSQLNEQEKFNVNAQLDFDVPKADRDLLDKALADTGDVLSRSTSQVPPGQAASDRKVGYRLTIKSTNAIAPREKVTLTVEVKDVDEAAAKLIGLVEKSKGVIPTAKLTQDRGGKTMALLLFNVPVAAKEELVRDIRAAGTVRAQDAARDHRVPLTRLATAHVDVTLTSAGPIVPSDEGLWPQIRTSLFYSFKLLSWSLMFIILGLSVVLPWVLVLWLVSSLWRRWRRKTAGSTI